MNLLIVQMLGDTIGRRRILVYTSGLVVGEGNMVPGRQFAVHMTGNLPVLLKCERTRDL